MRGRVTQNARDHASSRATMDAARARNFSSARNLCEMEFFVSVSISAYVTSYPSGSNTGSHPKSVGPRAGTIFPCVFPTNVVGSASSGPEAYAKTHCAYADLSSYAASMLFNPSCPVFSKNHFTYGPGNPFRALKHSDVSSTSAGPPSAAAASRAFSRATSLGFSLKLGKVDLLRRQRERPVSTDDGAHFLELFRVSRDEGDRRRHGARREREWFLKKCTHARDVSRPVVSGVVSRRVAMRDDRRNGRGRGRGRAYSRPRARARRERKGDETTREARARPHCDASRADARAAPGVFSGWASGAGTDAWWGRRARASSSSASASSASRARVVARGEGEAPEGCVRRDVRGRVVRFCRARELRAVAALQAEAFYDPVMGRAVGFTPLDAPLRAYFELDVLGALAEKYAYAAMGRFAPLVMESEDGRLIGAIELSVQRDFEVMRALEDVRGSTRDDEYAYLSCITASTKIFEDKGSRRRSFARAKKSPSRGASISRRFTCTRKTTRRFERTNGAAIKCWIGRFARRTTS